MIVFLCDALRKALSAAELKEHIEKLFARIAELERENEALRAKHSAQQKNLRQHAEQVLSGGHQLLREDKKLVRENEALRDKLAEARKLLGRNFERPDDPRINEKLAW